MGRVLITASSGSVSDSLIVVVSESASVGRFAYVAGNVDGTISAFTVNAATGQLRHNGYAFAGQLPEAVVVDAGNKFVYVLNSGDNSISAFLINSNGALTAVAGSPFPTGSKAAVSMTVDPSGAFAYVANSGSNDVSAFSIDPTTGALTAIAGSPFPAGAGPQSIVTDPFGKFVYVTNFPANNVSAYTIDPATGALTAMAGSPFMAGSEPSAVAVDPTGHFAYVANSGSADISAFSINSPTGALTALAGSPFPTGAGMEIAGLTVSPSGQFLYVANFGSASVSAFTVSASGSLSAITGSPFPVRSEPRSVQIDPAGKFAYVPNLASDEVEVFAISAAGALNTAGTVRTRQQAAAIALSVGTAAVTYTPKFAYVVNAGSNDVSVYSVNGSTGALTSTGTLRVSRWVSVKLILRRAPPRGLRANKAAQARWRRRRPGEEGRRRTRRAVGPHTSLILFTISSTDSACPLVRWSSHPSRPMISLGRHVCVSAGSFMDWRPSLASLFLVAQRWRKVASWYAPNGECPGTEWM